MDLRRASILLPCSRLDDLPTRLDGDEAADLLAAWTTLWHPMFIAATGALPGWYPADEPPDPDEMDSELVLVPSASRHRLAIDWCDRVRATGQCNPPPVEPDASRELTVEAAMQAAGLVPGSLSRETAADFFALGYTHLQVELLTRAMRYTSVLDDEQFADAAIAAAKATVAGDAVTVESELGRAFDLLADARNHVYAVDFYVVDVTLLASSTLGESLRAKLALASPTNVLLNGELLEELAREQPDTLAALSEAIASGTACPLGGAFSAHLPLGQSPEALLVELQRGQESALRHLGRGYEVYGQFDSHYPRRLPEVLRGMGFVGALHAAFDGGRMPKADQCKTWWSVDDRPIIETLAAAALDVSRPETWLRFAEHLADTIAHHHVATLLLAGWPGMASESFDDFRRSLHFAPVLGRLLTLDEYFRVTRETDEWTRLNRRDTSGSQTAELGVDPISSRVRRYRQEVFDIHDRLASALTGLAGGVTCVTGDVAANHFAINPWSFGRTQYLGCDPLSGDTTDATDASKVLVETPGCGYASISAAAPQTNIALAVGKTLRNERFEVTINETTGGIQSLRTHRDRKTRVSQRLVYCDRGGTGDSRMVADRIEISRNDAVIGEITSHGRVLSESGELLAGFRQAVRVLRAARAMFVDIELSPEQIPEGTLWNSYYGSRIAWADDALGIRCGREWSGSDVEGERIESPEWVEVNDGFGTITCYGLGLAYHRQVGANLLDTLLCVAGETTRRFQFALAIDDRLPAKSALGLLTAGRTFVAELPELPESSSGWLLYVGAKNVLVTHVEQLATPAAGIRVRLLETAGVPTQTILEAFRPVRSAHRTDFRSQPSGVLSVTEGRVRVDLEANEWMQLEVEW